ncbi:MAG: caspase family protein [Desulforhopalus sp.]|nr:caspase family protein [Desulforhopalus sp.]
MIFLQKLVVILWVALLVSCTATTPPASLQLSGIKMSFDSPVKAVTDMAISKDGSRLIAIDNGMTIESGSGRLSQGQKSLHIWDLVQGRRIKKIAIHDLQDISSIALSPDGKYALIAGRPVGSQSGLGLWDLDRGVQLRTFPELKWEVSSVAFSPDGKTLVATHNTFASLFNTDTGAFITQFDAGYQSYFLPLPIRLLATFSPDGQYILTGGTDATLKLWDIDSGKKVQVLIGHERGHAGGITGMAFSSDGQFVFTSSASDNAVRKWDIANGQVIQKFSSGLGSGAWGTAISPNNKLGFVSSHPLSLWDLENGRAFLPLSLYSAPAQPSSSVKPVKAVFLPNGKSLLLLTGDAAIRFLDVKSGKQLALLVGFDSDEWITVSSEGYFNASGKGADSLKTNLEGKNIPLGQFYDSFYRPDIIMTILQGENGRNVVTPTLAEAANTPPPLVQFTNTPDISSRNKVCYQATGKDGIGEIRLKQNGKLIMSDGYYREMVKSPSERIHIMAMNGPAIQEQMRALSLIDPSNLVPASSQEKGTNFTDCMEVESITGENEIAITAFNRANTFQGTWETLKFQSAKPRLLPHLYILSIGINKHKEKAINLKYATKNATDVQQRIRRQASSLFSPDNIHHELLLNDTANKTNILKKINDLATIIKPEDSFILFVGGNGILIQNQYYLLTSNFDGVLSDANTISSNELVDISKKIKSLSQLFIFDTCHAGGVDDIVGSLYEARMSVLAKKMGVNIFTSTSSVQEALDGFQGNGLFTLTLLDGLNNKQEVDRNGDKMVSMHELGHYANQKTTSLSQKLGFQQAPLILSFGKDTPIYMLP